MQWDGVFEWGCTVMNYKIRTVILFGTVTTYTSFGDIISEMQLKVIIENLCDFVPRALL